MGWSSDVCIDKIGVFYFGFISEGFGMVELVGGCGVFFFWLWFLSF